MVRSRWYFTEEGNQLSLALSPAISAPQHLVTWARHRPDWWYTRLATNTAELLPLSAKVCVFLPPEKRCCNRYPLSHHCYRSGQTCLNWMAHIPHVPARMTGFTPISAAW